MFLIDTHVHTSEVSQCGKMSARETVERYAAAGYGALIITDHYYDGYFRQFEGLRWEEQVQHYLSGYLSARACGEALGVTVLLGAELRFSYTDSPNDYLLYGIDEAFLLAHPRLYDRPAAEAAALLHEQGGLLFQAHPYRPGLTREHLEYLDGVEVFNGNPRHNSHNDCAAALARRFGLRASSGSDCHQAVDVARGGLRLERPVSSNAEWIEALRSGEFALIGAEAE